MYDVIEHEAAAGAHPCLTASRAGARLESVVFTDSYYCPLHILVSISQFYSDRSGIEKVRAEIETLTKHGRLRDRFGSW